MKKGCGYLFLEKVRMVNEMYLDLSEKGVNTENIYRKHIRPRFFISRRSFYRYLTIPYKGMAVRP